VRVHILSASLVNSSCDRILHLQVPAVVDRLHPNVVKIPQHRNYYVRTSILHEIKQRKFVRERIHELASLSRQSEQIDLEPWLLSLRMQAGLETGGVWNLNAISDVSVGVKANRGMGAVSPLWSPPMTVTSNTLCASRDDTSDIAFKFRHHGPVSSVLYLQWQSTRPRRTICWLYWLKFTSSCICSRSTLSRSISCNIEVTSKTSLEWQLFQHK
jgi:hypothetical protein